MKVVQFVNLEIEVPIAFFDRLLTVKTNLDAVTQEEAYSRHADHE